jgi:hypothetical protein
MYFNARWFDTSLGRFSQADILVPGTSSPMLFDRYAGMMNNPLKFIDPSGYCSTDPYDEYYDYECYQLAEEISEEFGKDYDDLITMSYEELKKLLESLRNELIASGNPPYQLTATPSLDDLLSTVQAWEILPTPTPLPVCTADPSYTPPVTSGPNFYLDHTEVDWVDLGIDVVGIGADAAAIFVPPVAAGAEAVAATVELIDGGINAIGIFRGDIESVRELTIDQIINTLEANPIIIAQLGRAIPLLGILGNAYSIYVNLRPAIKPIPQ